MANFGKLGEQVKGLVLASGLAFAPMTAATAEDVQGIISQNTFTSLQQANRAAQSAGMIVARAYNGEVRIVSAELANLLDTQGFRLGSDGILYGFKDGAIFEGFNFAAGVNFLENNSKKVKIEAERSDNDEEDVGEGPEDTEEDTPEATEEDTPEDTEEDTPEDTEEDTEDTGEDTPEETNEDTIG